MSHRSVRRASRAALLLAGFLCSTDLYAADRLTIRVYGDSIWDDEGALPAAFETAASIVDEAGIRAEWLDCLGGAAAEACKRVRGPRDIIVRLASRYIAQTAAWGGAVRVGDAASGLILGVSVVDRATRVGTLATVFLAHVQEAASRTGVNRAALLGRVLAHEVGHLLRGTGHSRTGLMREVWTGEELGLNRHDDWSFDRPVQREMRDATSRR